MYACDGEGPIGPVGLEALGAWNPGCQLGDTLYHKVNLKDTPLDVLQCM